MKLKTLLFVLAASMLSMACEENTESIIEKDENFYISMVCSPSASWFKYYDITVEYTDITGIPVTLTLSETKPLDYSAVLPLKDSRLAKTFSCRVKAVAKQAFSEVDESLKDDFSSKTNIWLAEGPSESEHSLYVRDATWIGLLGDKNVQGMPVKNLLERYPEGFFINMTYTR